MTDRSGWLPLPAPGATPVRTLTVAGSDSGGGAGIEADLRTFTLLGVHGCVALTAVTVQNSLGVTGVQEVDPDVVAAQIDTVVGDIGVSGVKTGMLASAPIVAAVADAFARNGIGAGGEIGLVIDPVCASMHGDPLLHPEALRTLIERLFPMATLVTPNLDEVRLITGIEVDDDDSQRAAVQALLDLGPRWALVKGGHLRGAERSPDLLSDGRQFLRLDAPRIPTAHDHGAGDTLAAAAAAALAHGLAVPDAAALAKDWITRCVAAAYPLGAGHGPVNPLWRLRPPNPAPAPA